MSKLLRANMVKLWKDKIFWICFWGITLIGLGERTGMGMDKTEIHILDEAFWVQALLSGIFMAVFVGLFVGMEYENGTIRNKIIMGYTRFELYFANVFTCIAAGWFLCLGCLASSLLVGVPLLGFFHTQLQTILWQEVAVFVLCAAYASIFCAIAMLNTNRAITVVVCFLLALGLLVTGSAIASPLEEPEYFYIPKEDPKTGDIEDGTDLECFVNPDYLQEDERYFQEMLLDILPGGQSLQLSGMLEDNGHYRQMIAASFGWSVLVSGFGFMLFRKKDLK